MFVSFFLSIKDVLAKQKNINKQETRKQAYPVWTVNSKAHPDELHIVLIDGLWWGVVFAAGREVVVRMLDDVFVVEVGQDGHEETSVPVVSDSPAIVTLPCQVCDGLKGNLIVLVYKEL